MKESFTTLVQNQVDQYCSELLMRAEDTQASFKSGTEYRIFLNDPLYMNTTDFIIRRFIQKRDPGLFSFLTGETINDLQHGLNTAWSSTAINYVAHHLDKQSKARRTKIPETDWEKYLSQHVRLSRDRALRIAFTLRMNPQETQELLLAAGLNKYCMRDPIDLIVYFCQKREYSYNWSDVQKLINRLPNMKLMASGDSRKAGPTQYWTETVDRLISSTESEDYVQDKLIQAMIDRKEDFNSLEMTNYEAFIRFAEILAVIYPFSYTDRNIYRPSMTESGIDFSALIAAMYSSNEGWLKSSISPREKGHRSTSAIVRRKIESDLKEETFYQEIQTPIDNLVSRIANYRRIVTNSPNYKNVEREIIILFSYFFIRKCEELLLNQSVHKYYDDQLIALNEQLESGDYIAKTLYSVETQLDEMQTDDARSRGNLYRNMVNTILETFNMHPMYLPCPFDRFIYLCLFGGEVSSFISAVMQNSPEEITHSDSELARIEKLYDELSQKHPKLTRILPNNRTETIFINSIDFYIGKKLDSVDDNYYRRPDYGINTKLPISRLEARISFDGKDFFIADVSGRFSTDGVDVGGNILGRNNPSKARAEIKYLNKTLLHNNDRIHIADQAFFFSTH